ncbi:MAG: patatin-like phospholipase family protein [Myxococcales bacterium]|nr:patatin-like phospholipase family protein [Myxococcales bacterium]
MAAQPLRDPGATLRGPRRALVLSGGGARGAYEVGVLAALFEEILPELPADFEFDVMSGTSVGAIHAAYAAASADLPPAERARRLVETWSEMRVRDVLRLSVGDLFGIPLRALGLSRLRRRFKTGTQRPGEADVVGGLVDLAPLEQLVAERIPWMHLRGNLKRGRPGALCVSCTEVRTGKVTVFMDGELADPAPWRFDPNAQAIHGRVTPEHVRASAAIPFLFPAVRISDRYYVDGGLRMNTPLSPALRLEADRVLVIALKHAPGSSAGLPAYPEDVITQPAFLLGKVLNALMLDQLEYELRGIELVNSWIERGSDVYGDDFLPQINEAVREKRGVDYRDVSVTAIRPHEDIGALAAACYERSGRAELGVLPALLTRAALRGVPAGEADLLSYLYFDRCFTRELIALGQEDTRRRRDEILELLA